MSDLIDIINKYQTELNLEDFELTREEHQTDILHIIKANVTYEDEYTLTRTFHSVMISKLSTHLNTIQKQLESLNTIETPEQRTPAWYEQRMKLISASDCKIACGSNKLVAYKKLVLKKLGIEESLSGFADAMVHGTMYEIVSQRLYETRFGVKIREYGCITHPKHTFIGASPDGIVNEVLDNRELAQVSRLGRMLEIKNPYSRIIDETIKPEYASQIQQQLEVCNLHLCDFLETDIRSAIRKTKAGRIVTFTPIYNSFEDFINDKLEDATLAVNNGIPLCNHSKTGNERGVLLQFKNVGTTGRSHLSVLYPIEIPYIAEEIEAWKSVHIKNMSANGYQLEYTHYWKLLKFDVKTVTRDDSLWQRTILPGLTRFWNDVERCRVLNNEQILEEFNGMVELETNRRAHQQQPRFSDEEVLPQPEPKIIIKRKLRVDYDNFESTVAPTDVFRFSDE